MACARFNPSTSRQLSLLKFRVKRQICLTILAVSIQSSVLAILPGLVRYAGANAPDEVDEF
jgi:hypothetical protein